MSELGVGFPLAPQQRRLWAAGGREAGTPFVARCVVRIVGELDLDAMLRAMSSVAARHEILRTTFHLTEDMAFPLQVIGPEPPRVAHLDLRPQSSQSLANPDPTLPTSTALLLTTSGQTEHQLTIRVPALCCDRRGLENLVEEISRAYETDGRDSERAEPPLQYADASAWLNEAAAAEEGATGRDFWQRQGHASGVRLPFDRASTDAPFAPGSQPLGRVPAAVAETRDPAGLERLTLACWLHLLQRLADTPAARTAIEVNGRQYAELEAAVGLYARTLPLAPVDTTTTSTAEAGEALAAAAAEATRWSETFDCPGVEGVPFVFESRRGAPTFEARGVTLAVAECEAPADRFQLKLVCQATADGAPELALHYDTAHFGDQDIRDLGTLLRTLIAGAATAPPTAALRSQPLLDRNSWREYVSGPAENPQTLPCIHRLFEDCARSWPERVAVTFESEQLTHSQLNARANQLAHRLIRLGVGPDIPVGLCLGRSHQLIVGMLGILKAGGGYVVLDPKLPTSRLATMAAAAGAPLVVTDRATSEARPIGRPVLLDDTKAPLDAEPAIDPASPVEPGHLAYVLFTSGSTGQPKGVAVEHRQLSCYVEAARKRLDLPPGATYATVTTMASDLGNTSIFPALSSGGHLHIVSEERAADAAEFAEYCERHPIDVLKIVPSHLRALLTVAKPSRVLPRERLILGGEACPWELVDLVRQLAPALRVFNHYGPTETTVGATAFEVLASRGPADGPTVPIGCAFDHATTYVLDEARRPVPNWFTGELYIGGHGVARGYVNAPADGATPFAPDVFSTQQGHRMYRTGDRVRLRPGRVLEFIGRIDDQVKIRGFRIEPGEVAATLRLHPAVRDAAVVVTRGGGAAALIAVVASEENASTFERFLSSCLPDYMMPRSIVVVPAIPLNANGKVDRSAIEDLASRAAARSTEQQELVGEWEDAVAILWRELLEVDHVGPNDNFYDLGGHSLLAIQAVTSLEKRRGVKVAARDLVFHTLRQFASLCESRATARA